MVNGALETIFVIRFCWYMLCHKACAAERNCSECLEAVVAPACSRLSLPGSIITCVFVGSRYLLHVLDQYVQNDYVLVYFHFGLNSDNKLPVSWLVQAYKCFDRK